MTPSGIEHATFRLVAQCQRLNHTVNKSETILNMHSVQYWRNDFDQGRAGFKFRNLPRFDQLVKALRYKLEGRGFDS